MDTEEEFFPNQGIDRSAYLGCYLVALVTALVFFGGVYFLWQAASQMKGLDFKLPGVSRTLPTIPQDLDQQVKDAASGIINDQTEKAKQSLRQEAEKQVKEKTPELKKDIQEEAGNSLREKLNL